MFKVFLNDFFLNHHIENCCYLSKCLSFYTSLNIFKCIILFSVLYNKHTAAPSCTGKLCKFYVSAILFIQKLLMRGDPAGVSIVAAGSLSFWYIRALHNERAKETHIH